MTSGFNRKIQATILIGSILMVAACASTKTGETIANQTDQAARIALEKGKLETLPEPTAGAAKVVEPVNTAPVTALDGSQATKSAVARINQKEPLVNVRTAPTARSRVVAVLKKGQEVEVLENKYGWLKIKWKHGATLKHGWMNKSFVEGYEQ